MKSSVRAETCCFVLGQMNDLDSGDMQTGWWVMKIGEVRDKGSIYSAARSSSNLGRVDDLSGAWPFSSRRERRDSRAPGDSRSGRGNLRADSREGMNSSCWKGGENLDGGMGARESSLVVMRDWQWAAAPEMSSSVRRIRSGRLA